MNIHAYCKKTVVAALTRKIDCAPVILKTIKSSVLHADMHALQHIMYR